MTLIGKVTHYFDHIAVAVVELSGPLKLGDTVVIKYRDEENEQVVESMQVDKENIESAKKGDTVGLHVDHHTHEGAQVFKK